VALEDASIIMLDERHPKELVTLSVLFWRDKCSMRQAMVELVLQGLPAYFSSERKAGVGRDRMVPVAGE
jgi:hypothetical protein